ncbi:MAG: hypothetical protein H5T44_06280 [Thermoplasmatales archaeon]|nr:hypothetical protein [Thermoplasmatales archaeon]
MKGKIVLGVVISLILINGILGKGGEKPFLHKEEIEDFLTSLGIDEITISTLNISDIYLSDIPDDFWSWMNVSKEEGAKIVKDMINKIINNELGALEKFIELFSPEVETERPILTFGPETLEEVKSDPWVIAVYGEIPEFDTQEERWEWIDKLHKINEKERIEKFLEEYDYPNGPICMTGADERKGCFDIGIWEEYELDENLLNEIYLKIDAIATSLGIKNVPVIFAKASPLIFDVEIINETPLSETKINAFQPGRGRNDTYRPIIGGIQVTNYIQQTRITSTLGWPAKRGNTKGYVVSGHLGPNNLTPLNIPIYQPDRPDEAGRVERRGGNYSDAAFVNFSNVAPLIYTVPYGSRRGIVTGYWSPNVGAQVYMSGIASGWTTGEVAYTGWRVVSSDRVLYNQTLATYLHQQGDSGAPVLSWGRELIPGVAFVTVYGIHGGATIWNYRIYAVFSPVSGVYTDMGVTPLTIRG